VLRVDFQPAVSSEPVPSDAGVSIANVSAAQGIEAILVELKAQISAWRRIFACIVLNPTADLTACADALEPVCDWNGYLLGPWDRMHSETSAHDFVVQDATGAALLRLSGREQLIPDVANAERAHASQQPVAAGFLRTVDSIARCIARLQVGLALGGGGAWAWSHIGVLRVLERAGLPVDGISGEDFFALSSSSFAFGAEARQCAPATRCCEQGGDDVKFGRISRFMRMQILRSASTRKQDGLPRRSSRA